MPGETKLTGAEVAERMQIGAARGINVALDDLAGEAQRRAPLELGRLRESEVTDYATAEKLEGQVSFNTPYAAAQHEGHAIQHRSPEHPGGGPTLFQATLHHGRARYAAINYVYWHAVHYTTPGTGPKYLENPLKEMSARYERIIAASAQAEIEGRA